MVAFDPEHGNPVAIELGDGGRLLLVGRIDRLDRREGPAGTYGVVLDYKSSARTQAVTRLRRGLDLQLAAYLLYVRQLLLPSPIDVLQPSRCRPSP